MRNKILLLLDSEEKEMFEQYLTSFIDAGGEVFFADKKEVALEIVKKEHPQLVFLDAQFFTTADEWKKEGAHLYVLQDPGTTLPFLHLLQKPVSEKMVIDLCHQIFAASTALPPPPMM